MAYDMTFMNKYLRKNKDDAKRAEVYDELYPKWNEQQQVLADRLYFIGANAGFGVNGAKAFAVEFILFWGLPPDEQDRWIAHGRAIQSEYEWAIARKTRKQAMQELEETA